ncbi:2b269531-e530-4eb7-ab25-91184f394da8 [Thermothielavioides terrestris]|uniref:2b269531-e530-4eb7-ab25-91184f394da8 n=1 Tax=Thermothielavioides terrestris TaxID=2587410 RepID=A0A446B5E9_9PEZI|nr:2b269531-e530-4eb7-ab25-91184f394da8 [Thermothielavioides terrestris]
MGSDMQVPQPKRAAEQSQQPQRRTRNRIPLACEPCRARKLRCNREKPCHNCTARNEQASCRFRGRKNGPNGSAPGAAEPAAHALRQRIDHLESLVQKLIDRNPHAPLPSGGMVCTPESSHSESGSALSADASDPLHVPGAGKTVTDGVHSVYLGGDDWHVVLEEIRELKQAWSQEDDGLSDHSATAPALSHPVDGSSLLFNQVKPLERIEILATLPPKAEVDRLISYFFDRQAFPIRVPPILHEPTFRREYEEHWRDPSRTNFIWLGLLFSILGIAMLAYHQHGEPPEYEGISESLFQLYRVRTSQCLLSGDISKGLPYTVETLRFNATAELNRRDDNRRGLWLMSAVVVRAAINMGYHRDPSRIPGLTPFQAEYRRRAWLSVVSMDDMASFLGGFPRMTAALCSDTAEPRNLHDWELSPDAAAPLPPSRPLTEPTPATYLIVKGRLLRALGRVADFHHGPPPLDTVKSLREVDRAVHDAYASFPPHMKLDLDLSASSTTTTTNNSIPNTPWSQTAFTLLAMYHRGMCTLHRRFLARARRDPRLRFSRARCLASALALLALQRRVLLLPPTAAAPAAAAGGGGGGGVPAAYAHWQMRQTMVLAAMVVVLELEVRRRPDMSSPGLDAFERVPSFDMDFSNMDLDWATWDAFLDNPDPNFETAPVY